MLSSSSTIHLSIYSIAITNRSGPAMWRTTRGVWARCSLCTKAYSTPSGAAYWSSNGRGCAPLSYTAVYQLPAIMLPELMNDADKYCRCVMEESVPAGWIGEASFVHTIVSRSSSAVDALREHFLQQLLRCLVDALSVVLSDRLGLAELLV